MTTSPETRLESSQERLAQVLECLEHDDLVALDQHLAQMHPAEIANLLEALPRDQREVVWSRVPAEEEGEVLLYVNDEVRSDLIREMDREELVAAAGGMDTDDLADILPDLPEPVISELLQSMSEQDRQRLETVLIYPDDTAGGLMNLDTVSIRPHVTLEVVLRYLRFRGELPEPTDSLFVVNREDKYLGRVRLAQLVTSDPTLTVAEILDRDLEPIPADTPATEVARLFEDHDLVSAPVVDENGKLLGRITIDDVVDLIREQADHDIMARSGLDEEDDMFAPVLRSSRRRAVWLGVNLVTAFLAAWVIGLFDATIEKVVALAVLMPIVASMGGIAGTQTLTLMIRGIALGQVSASNAWKLLRKEVLVSLVNGILWAVVVAIVAIAWFHNVTLGVVIGLAIVVNLLVAAVAGALIPLGLQKLGADPALAGGVVLTTVTDVVGFMAFLGLATLFLV